MQNAPEMRASAAARRGRALRVAQGQRGDGRRDDRGQRRVRAEDEDPAGPEDGVEQQRDDRGVQAGDGRQAGGLGVAHPDRDQDRGQDEARDDVGRQPRPLVGASDPDAGDEPQDSVRHRASRIIQA